MAALALPPLIAVTPHQGGDTLLWFAVPLAIFVVWKHRANIGRLMRGEENRFRRRGAAIEAAPEAPPAGPES